MSAEPIDISEPPRRRVRTYALEAQRLRQAEDWFAHQRELWERHLDQMDEYLLKLKEQQQ